MDTVALELDRDKAQAIEEIVARIEAKLNADVRVGEDDLRPLIASWRARGEALQALLSHRSRMNEARARAALNSSSPVNAA